MDRIYFIQAGRNGPIKIGRATKPKNRLRYLQTSSSEKLILLYDFEMKIDSEETYLHMRFKKDRIRGEWFKPDNVRLYISELKFNENKPIGLFCAWCKRKMADRTKIGYGICSKCMKEQLAA